MRRSPVGCFLIILALLVIGIPLISFSLRAAQDQNAALQSADTQFHVLGRGDVEVAVSAVGQITSDETASLTFRSPGRVAEIFVQVGDLVMAGQPVARLENDTQQIALEQARLSVELAQLKKEDLLAGPDSGEIAVAQANIEAARGAAYALQQTSSADDIRAAELAVQQAEAALAAAETARRTASSGQPEQQYQLLDAQIGQASFNAQIARLQLEQLQSGNSAQVGAAYERVNQQQAVLEQLMAGPTQSQIDSADASIAQAQSAYEQAQQALDDTLLTAPFDGVITSLSIEVGSLVSSSLPAGEVLDYQPLRVEVKVDEIDIRDIYEGMPVTVTLDALDGIEFPGALEQIAVIGQNNAGIISYPVTLRLDALDDARVRTGMTAEASMVIESRQDVLVVPNEYVRLDRRENRAYVNIVTDQGTLEEIEIVLGLQGDEVSEVVSGLSEGDVIAVDLGGDAIPAFGG